MEQKVEEVTLREWFTKGSLLYLYMLTVTLLGLGLGIWLGFKLGRPGIIVLGIAISQLLMVFGSCGIVLWRRK